MSDGAQRRNLGSVFDQVAEDYDRHRPAYPDVLLDRASEVAGLRAGDRVLEIGCGTGQLTQGLLARGLRVTAVEPGGELIARARHRLAGAVDFVHARWEDAPVSAQTFSAAFSASAIHWIDPDTGWRKLAGSLSDGGTIALLSYFGLRDEHSEADHSAQRAGLLQIAPDLAGDWPVYRDYETTLDGVAQRRRNISEAWSWLGGYEIGRPDVAELFGEAELASLAIHTEHSAAEINALLGTMSFWSRVSPQQRTAVATGNEALEQRLGRQIRSSMVACLLTARRPSPAWRPASA